MTSLVALGQMIRLSHSVFALPFALASAWMASEGHAVGPWRWAGIVAAVVLARATAMAFNRVVDRDIDGLNPRTKDREIPSGKIGLTTAVVFTAATAAAFVAVAFSLGPLVGWLSPIALAVVWGYSWTKRFTSWCHAVLGLALALAPTGAWLAVRGTYDWTPFWISLAVATWVAGFDMLYSTQDRDFDAGAGLHSAPVKLGLARTLALSTALHVGTMAFLAAVAWVSPRGPAYAVGWVIMAVVLAYEHHIVRPDDLSRLDKAFFDLNGAVSLLFLGGVLLS